MVKKFWILMLVLGVLSLGAASAVQTGSLNQFKINSLLEYGNLNNYQSALDNYTENSNKTTINTDSELLTKKFDSHIIMESIVGTMGECVQINATLINNQNGKAIEKQQISFYGPDGNIIGKAKTNKDGKATYKYTITQTPDKYSLKASYKGSCIYYPAESNTSLQVNRWNITIHVDDINCKYGDIVPVIVTTLNATNKAPIVGKMVNLRLSDGTFVNQGKRDSNGQFIYNYTVTNSLVKMRWKQPSIKIQITIITCITSN